VFLSRRWEHLHAKALQIRAELSTHIHRETGDRPPQRPTHSFWSFLFEKTKLECGKKPPAFCQRQAHNNAVRHAARSRPARSAPGHRARTRASSRKTSSHPPRISSRGVKQVQTRAPQHTTLTHTHTHKTNISRVALYSTVLRLLGWTSS